MIPAVIAGGAAVLTAGALLAGTASSPASVGAGIQVGPVRVTVAPGTAQRARVMVQDTGSATETLTVLGGRETRDGRIVPLPWVRHASVTTAPGTWRTVTFTIAVPPGTPTGECRRYVGAGVAAAGTPGGYGVGAASYTDLIVTVTPFAASGH
jgi:hypothetical protein